MSRFNLSEWAIRNRSLVIFLMIGVVVAGTVSFLKLGRAEDPVFTIRTMVVQAQWPGATLDETLQQVTERIERTLQEVPNLDTLRSYTVPGTTVIFVDLVGSAQGRTVTDTWYEVRKKVADMRHTLPQGVLGPGFNDDFGDTFGIIYGFTADGFTHRELRNYVEDVRSRLLTVPDVSKIELLGEQDERIHIDLSLDTLAGLGVDPGMLVAAMQAQNAVRPAGVLRTGREALSLQVSGSFESERDILDVNFAVGGRMLRLRELAEVRRDFADPPQPLFRVNGQPAIGLAIAMRPGGDILSLGKNISAEMARISADLPLGIQAHLVADQARTVDDAVSDFITSLWQAILIVLVVSFLALGARAGTVVAITIPLTLAIVFPVMGLMSIDLQRVSLGALIIALALLVDDALTTVDAMTRRLTAGDRMEVAAVYAYKALAMAMLSGTLVTIAGFVPIGFAQSSAGEYTFSIFAVVGIALIASWLVAMVFAPLLGTMLLRPPKSGQREEPGPVLRLYRRALGLAIRARGLTIATTLALFVLSITALGLVPRQFFPPSDRVELLVDLRLPQNASIHATHEAVARLDALLAKEPGIARWSSYVGRGAIRFYLPLNVQLANPFVSQAVVVTNDIAARERLQAHLETLLAEEFPNAVARVYPLELGPPVGWPLQYRVMGPDPAEVREIALKLAQTVGTSPEARRINFDWMESARKLRVQIDQDEARRLGLSSAAVASLLNATVSGTVVTSVRDGIYLIDVLARDARGQTLSVETLRSLPMPLPNGRSVPLNQLATFDYTQDQPLVWRRNRVPTLTVQADVAPGVLPETVIAALSPRIADLSTSLPSGYRIELGGIAEESAKSRASVFAVVPIMTLLVLTVLMVELGSFQRLLMVLSVVPLGLIGVVLALLASGQPLGFVAILGVLALVGMIAKNAVILIQQIEAERRAGLGVMEAVIEASGSRFRPIMLTAASTVLGLIPIAFTVFWGAMAFAIMGGLLVASLLTLVFLPTLYVAWFGSREEVRERKAAPFPPSAV
ncbi:efflux RND transporter permease subunit [Azospirillum sp. TSA2s]|uniref:efflux RND transporter permease subunit n=1 Tax=Azospirillum sp. TSA2s TaxID=709810 RepID=UPI0010A9E0BE|nr:efflux RND transporter permease subunit [Azospirillum sp. TSA2s]QCG95360.1 efflux RND transporter permease subunit [Azospirillum sp. TSA2s]